MEKDIFIRTHNTDTVRCSKTENIKKPLSQIKKESLFTAIKNCKRDESNIPEVRKDTIMDDDSTYVHIVQKSIPIINLSDTTKIEQAPETKPKIEAENEIETNREPQPNENKVNENREKITNSLEKLKYASGIDIPYWTEKLDSISSKYNFPAEILIGIIDVESGFKKNIKKKVGNGPMGITTIAVQAFFPGAKGNWHDYYKQMNEPLLNDILYKKDSEGNFIKDAKGNFILKYKTPEALREACGKDDELGIKVGLLSFQMQYVCAVAGKHYKNSPIYKTAPKAIKALKDGSLKLNETDNKKCVEIALKNYNSVFATYASTVTKTLASQGMKFNETYI